MTDHTTSNADELNKAEKIKELNDAFRRTLIGGKLLMTSGVANLGPETVQVLLERVRTFEQFDSGNDPHGEHDFGAIEEAGEQYFWKIDYYDPIISYGSDDPADPAKTLRVLTILKSGEW